MVVGLPGQATLDASIFFTVFKVSSSYRPDAMEAIDIAAQVQPVYLRTLYDRVFH